MAAPKRPTRNPTTPVSVGPEPRAVDLSPDARATLEAEVAAGRVLAVKAEGGTAYFVPYGEGWAVPVTFTYDGTHRGIVWRIIVQVIEGRARCVRLIMDAPPGGFIQAEDARFPLGRLVEEAALLAAIELDASGLPLGPPIRERVTSVAEARKLHKQVEREHRQRARGGRRPGYLTDELLREVADVYRHGQSGGRPTSAVEDHFRARWKKNAPSRSTIGRWIEAAREAGYLGKAPGRGIGGEREEDNHG